MRLGFTRCRGGQRLRVLDATRTPLHARRAQIRRLADRHRGVGRPGAGDRAGEERRRRFRLSSLNGHRTEVEHCGNGARCFVRTCASMASRIASPCAWSTMNRRLVLSDAGIEARSPSTWVSRVSVHGDVLTSTCPMEGQAGWGSLDGQPARGAVRAERRHRPRSRRGHADRAPSDFPNGVNAGYAQMLDRHAIRLRVFERGAGETPPAHRRLRGGGPSASVAGTCNHPSRRDAWRHLTIAGPAAMRPLHMSGPSETVFAERSNCDPPSGPRPMA